MDSRYLDGAPALVITATGHGVFYQAVLLVRYYMFGMQNAFTASIATKYKIVTVEIKSFCLMFRAYRI
jgi:hypothetical protein